MTTVVSLSLADTLDQFASAMRSGGVEPPEAITADGRLHRFRVDGDKAGSKNGYYVLHADGVPAGLFGCYRRDIKEKWRANIGRKLTADERAAIDERLKAAAKAREAEQAALRKRARDKARALWNNAAEQVGADHRYLVANVGAE